MFLENWGGVRDGWKSLVDSARAQGLESLKGRRNRIVRGNGGNSCFSPPGEWRGRAPRRSFLPAAGFASRLVDDDGALLPDAAGSHGFSRLRPVLGGTSLYIVSVELSALRRE